MLFCSSEQMDSNKMSVSPLCDRLKQYKMTTPPWKDRFRKECMDRLRQNRRRLIDEKRRSYAGDIVEEEWTKLKGSFDDIDSHMEICEEIKKEMDQETDRIFAEYERCVTFGGAHPILILCANCGSSHNYSPSNCLPTEENGLVSFCHCGHLRVDRATKVMEPYLGRPELVNRAIMRAADHRLACPHAVYMTVIDNGVNDGTWLMEFCKVCGMQLVIW